MHLRGLVLLLLCLAVCARCSMLINDVHQDAQQQNSLANGLDVSANTWEALIPGGFSNNALRRGEPKNVKKAIVSKYGRPRNRQDALMTRVTASARLCTPVMAVQLHGSQQSRSPLVNWYAEEAGIALDMLPPRPSNHPFQQVPFLVDGDVEVFESGAILLYLADLAGPSATAADRAKYTKWVVWANSELDGLCFGAVPGDHRVRGTSMDKPELKSVNTLESILEENEWLLGDFSVADVAVGAYLNYVPIFFPNADLSRTPAIAAYMARCAQRPAFARAFGEQHAGLVLAKTADWLKNPSSSSTGGPAEMLKKFLG